MATAVRRQRAGAEKLAARVQGCAVVEAQQVNDACDMVLLAKPDAAIRALESWNAAMARSST